MNSEAKSKNTKKKKNYGNFLYDFIKLTGIIPLSIWLRPKLIYMGKKPKLKGGYMVFANHCSFMDPLLIHCIFYNRRIHTLATKDLYSNDLRTFMFDTMLCIQVDKANFSVDSFHEVVKLLKRGKVVCIFPEGRVSPGSDNILAFKSGMALMAYTAGVPIVPMYLLPTKKWYNRRVAVMGQPIDIKEMCGKRPSTADLDNVSKYLHEKELELQRYYHENFDKVKKDTEIKITEKEEV